MLTPIAVILPALLATPPMDPAARALAPEPVVAQALGLRLRPPAGAAASARIDDDGVSYVVSDPAAGWSMRLAERRPAVADPTPRALVLGHLDDLQAGGHGATVITETPRTLGDVTGHLAYARQALDDGEEIVRGWLVLPTSGTTFVVLTLAAAAERFGSLEPVLDASFETIELLGREERLRRHADRLRRGREVLGAFDRMRLASVAGRSAWYRVHRPSENGEDAEVGFLNVEVREGRRGELTPQRRPQDFGSLESQAGLLVELEARVIVDATRGHYLDVAGRYWLAWDRRSEAWSVLRTQRRDEYSRTSAETGIRDGMRLEVIESSREELTREPKLWTIPDAAYLSQVEVMLLGALLPRDEPQSADLTFYYYDTGAKRLSQRVDEWRRLDDGSGRWLLTTQPLLETAPIRQWFDAEGRRLRREGAGMVTERIDPQELRRLWRAKGLLAR